MGKVRGHLVHRWRMAVKLSSDARAWVRGNVAERSDTRINTTEADIVTVAIVISVIL